MVPRTKYEIITEIAKRRGFYWPSFEIYGGLSGFITYGDLGIKLKRNIEALWREFFVRKQGFLELEAPIINPERIFEASGHLENFKEYSSQCSECAESFRTDTLIEEKTGLENVQAMGDEAIQRLIVEYKLRCPNCGGGLLKPSMILTMFKTEIGATGGEVGYARPETAQSMFINYKKGFLHAREKLPFATAQSSKVMRNEISPRRGMLRLREFTIMELELFFDPQAPRCPWFKDVAKENVHLLTEEMEQNKSHEPIQITIKDAVDEKLILTEWQGYFMGLSQQFVTALGASLDLQRFRAHLPSERAHYSKQTYDHEVKLETWGWTEISGCAYRTDFDLKNHMRVSGQDMSVLRDDGSRFLPHVVEPSFGLDRLVYVVLEVNYERKNNRNVFHFSKDISPFQVSVYPLVTKDGLPEKAKEIFDKLIESGFWAFYDESGSVGRRYARGDEIGVPLAVVVDYDTLDKGLLTIRDRESWEQVILESKNLTKALNDYFNKVKNFIDLGELKLR
jgi:glycyl-tRNA synthetase